MARMTPNFKSSASLKGVKAGRSLAASIPMDTQSIRIKRADSIKPPRRTVSMPRGGKGFTSRVKSTVKTRKMKKISSRRVSRSVSK